MTISSNATRSPYVGTGITGPYPVTFKFFEDADLKVTVADTNGVETVKALTTDYTVTGAGEQSGGSITFTTAVTNGYSIVIEPKADLTQDTDIKNEGGNLRESIEDRFDRLCRDDQVQQNLIDRSVKMQTTDADSVDGVLPPREAGALLGWSDDGTGFANRSASLFASDASITATDSNTPRWISDRHAEAANVRDYGALGNGIADDTAAFAAAITSGKPVEVPAGTFKITSVTIGPGCPGIFGHGNASVIYVAGNTSAIVLDANARFVDSLVFKGSGKGSGFASQIGLYIYGASYNGYRTRVSSCHFIDLAGNGMFCRNTLGINHMEGVQVNDCQFFDNNIGLRCITAGEYVTCTGCVFQGCNYGIQSSSGNNNLVGCKIVNCTSGINLLNGPNDTHGIATGCQFNHCTKPIEANNTQYGFIFTGCTFFEGTIEIVSSSGFHIRSGFLDVDAYTFTSSVGCFIEDNLIYGGYLNVPTTGASSRVQWRNNRSFLGAHISANSLDYSGQFEGGYTRALTDGTQTIATGANAVVKYSATPTNKVSLNPSYSGDTFCNRTTGEFTSFGYGNGLVSYRVQILFTGAGTNANTYLQVNVDGALDHYIPVENLVGTYGFYRQGTVRMNAGQKLTFVLYNTSGNTITLASSVNSYVEVEGL